MKKCFWISALAAAAVMFTACEKPENDDPVNPDNPGGGDTTVVTDAPKLTLTSESQMQIGKDGGQLAITYTLENPVADGQLSAGSDADWCSDFNYDTEGEVSFTVSPNEGEERQAAVTVTYDYENGPQSFSVTVVQSGNEGGGSAFDYEIVAASVSGIYWGGQHTISYNTDKEYELHISDADNAHNYVLVLYSRMPENLQAPAPPAGSYKIDFSDMFPQWTIDGNNSYFYTTDETASVAFTDGSMTIEKDGDNYSYLISLTDGDGKTHQVTYNGTVSLENRDIACLSTLEGDLDLTLEAGGSTIKGYYYGESDYPGATLWKMSLYSNETAKNSWCYQIHMLLPVDNVYENGIAPGTYTVNSSYEPMTIVSGFIDEDDWITGGWAYDILYNEDVPRGPMASGTVTVTVDDSGVYTFVFDCMDDNVETPHRITGTISGTPNVMDLS